jgi:hypothetical protein
MPKKDDHFAYLLQDPKMIEIFTEVVESIPKNLPLDQSHRVIVREWLNFAHAKRNQLELEAQHGMFSDRKYELLRSLKESIERMENL